MSRTTRKSPDEHDHRCYQEVGDCDYLKNLNGRDGKERGPSGWWKRFRRRGEKRKAKEALRRGREVPVIKKNDDWEWY